MNRTQGIVAGAVVAVLAVAVAIWAFDFEITEEGRLPSADVNIDVDPGKLPEADIDSVDIDIGTAEKEVLVPDVEVTVEKETITVPTIDVTPPDAGEPNSDAASENRQ